MDTNEHSSVKPAADAHAGHDPHEEIPKDLPKVRTAGMAVTAGVLVLGFAGLFALAWFPREKRLAELHESPQSSGTQNAKPIVQVVSAERAKKAQDLVLPADARALQETSIFPRASGYLKKFTVDIGDHVEAGQLLAEIEAPDVDADLAQAQAALGLAKANLTKAHNDLELNEATFKRYESFGTTGGVTQQQLDERKSAYIQSQSAVVAAEANVKAADAAVQRLIALQGFEKVIAPFAGTITARNYDLGALMSASNATGKELFRIADTSTLRVFVNVPQTYISSVAVGQPAQIMVRNFPGKEFQGTIARSTGVVDPATRTLRYQIDVPNQQDVLKAGMFANAKLAVVSGTEQPLVVPTSSLVFDASGTKVWTVQDGKVHAAKVTVGRDYGTEIEVAAGLNVGDSVVANPGERLADGVEVQLPKQNTQTASDAPATPERTAAAR